MASPPALASCQVLPGLGPPACLRPGKKMFIYIRITSDYWKKNLFFWHFNGKNCPPAMGSCSLALQTHWSAAWRPLGLNLDPLLLPNNKPFSGSGALQDEEALKPVLQL